MHLKQVVVFILVTCASPAAGQEQINTKAQALAVLAREYGVASDGQFTSEVIHLMNRDLRQARSPGSAKRVPRRPPSSVPTLGQEMPSLPEYTLPDPSRPLNKTTLLVRESYSPFPFITQNSEEVQKGAAFTYTHNGIKRESVFVAKGAVMLAMAGDLPVTVSDPNQPHLTYYSFLPGFEFNRLSSSRDRKNHGSQSAKLGVELETQQGGLFTTQYFRMDANYTTDYDQKAKIYGADFLWTPKPAEGLFIGTDYRFPILGGTWVKFIPTFSADIYHVDSAGRFARIRPGHTYAWIGPKLSLDVGFDAFPRFSLYSRYYYLSIMRRWG